MFRNLTFLSMAVLPLLACGGSKDDSGTGSGTAAGTAGGTVGGTAGGTVSSTGWSMTGTAVDFATQAPAAEGLCIDVLDPSPALTGGAPALLVSSTVGANGAISIDGIVTSSVLGLLLSIKDCGTENTTVFTSATGVPYEDIRYLTEGDTLAGVTALSIDMAFLGGMQTSAEVVGYTGDMETEGIVFGLLRDAAGVPIDGGTVTCGSCGPTYYLDGDAADGLFSTGAAANAGTVQAAGGVWVIPAGPVGQYAAEDGGIHTFPEQLNGSTPGSALVTAIYAN